MLLRSLRWAMSRGCFIAGHCSSWKNAKFKIRSMLTCLVTSILRLNFKLRNTFEKNCNIHVQNEEVGGAKAIWTMLKNYWYGMASLTITSKVSSAILLANVGLLLGGFALTNIDKVIMIKKKMRMMLMKCWMQARWSILLTLPTAGLEVDEMSRAMLMFLPRCCHSLITHFYHPC